MNKNILSLTAFLGALGVVTGALAAHALKTKLSPDDIANVHTAVLYQMMHVLAVLAIAAIPFLAVKTKNRIAVLFLTAILFFSGSIYLISIFGINPGSIWFITPLGGLLFIAGWLYLALAFYKSSRHG